MKVKAAMNCLQAGATQLRITQLLCLLFLFAICGCDSQPAIRPLAGDATILAFGDSLTQGVGVKRAESYPAILASLTGRTVINAGISGEMSHTGLQRLPEMIAEHSPQLIIICHGGNDTLRRQSTEKTENNIRAMVKLARDQDIDVVLLAVPAFNLFATPPVFYKTIAGEFDIPFEADIIADLETDKSMKSDSVHFNAQGYKKMAEAIYKVLDDAGAI